jgi:predicted ester cyclase
VYSPYFHDHVNAREYHGHDGIRQSLGLYQLVFSDGDLRIHVEDQVTEGDHVASRWVAEGHNRGHAIRIWGIVMSRVEDGEIIEDWAASDNVELIRQLGPWRTLLLCIAWLRRAADGPNRRVLHKLRLFRVGRRPSSRHVDHEPQA